jgi:undecaprenyl-phosphate 4-deoxy-4-formamido-L-arabinose transferase
MINYSVVIPVYRGELTVKKLADELIGFFNSELLSFELIFVDDFATDKSWDIIKSLKKDYGKAIRGIRFSLNYGQHNALLCGILNATGEYIITMDEDLQHSPSDIIRLINKQNEADYDLVYGRFSKLNHNKFRNLTSRLLKKLLKIGLPGYRLIKTGIARKIITKANSYTFLDAYFSSATSKIASTEVNHSKRYIGRSSYSLWKLVTHSTNIFLNYSIPLLRVLSWSFLILIFLSFSSGIFLVLGYVFNRIHIPGEISVSKIFAAFLILTVFVTGVILTAKLIISMLRVNKSGFIVSERI